MTAAPQIPEAFDEVLARPALGFADLPASKVALIALAKQQAALVVPFWSADGSWVTVPRTDIKAERIVDFGYHVTSDFLVIMAAVLRRYGVSATEAALAPLKGPKPRPAVSELGDRGARLNKLLNQAISLLFSIQIRHGVERIKGLPPSLAAKTDQLTVLLIKTAVENSHGYDETDALLWRLMAMIGLGQLSRDFQARGEQAPLLLSGPFSHLRLREFVDLANRTPALKARHATKKIETLFEDQLALLAQSFGFQVIRARRATRRVDLLCLMDDRVSPYTILIEAKTSGGAYALPADDQRALMEYVEDARASLGSLPPVQFVLLVGSKAASTVERKLAEVEVKMSLPVRFIDAVTLAQLRDRLPGPLPAKVFRDLLVRSETHVLTSGFVDSVVSAFERSHRAHVDFVQALLGDGA
jgi:hypothetical protein